MVNRKFLQLDFISNYLQSIFPPTITICNSHPQPLNFLASAIIDSSSNPVFSHISIIASRHDILISCPCNAKLYTSDDRFLPYNKSIFFRIEKALLVKDFSTENNQLEIRTVTKEEIDRLFDDPILPELSVEMLNTAASKNGQLMKFYTLEGLNICVDSIDFTKDKSPRNIAKVENAWSIPKFV